jgi:4-alpha-glucanotransferase
VLPWEKDWEKKEPTFRDPATFPASSVASWSTHDTLPIVAWWDELPEADRMELSKRAELRGSMDDDSRSLSLLRYLYGAKSELALVLAQELIGSRDRINTPATVGPHNWSWRLPKPIEDLNEDARLAGRFEAVRKLVVASGR